MTVQRGTRPGAFSVRGQVARTVESAGAISTYDYRLSGLVPRLSNLGSGPSTASRTGTAPWGTLPRGGSMRTLVLVLVAGCTGKEDTEVDLSRTMFTTSQTHHGKF